MNWAAVKHAAATSGSSVRVAPAGACRNLRTTSTMNATPSTMNTIEKTLPTQVRSITLP